MQYIAYRIYQLVSSLVHTSSDPPQAPRGSHCAQSISLSRGGIKLFALSVVALWYCLQWHYGTVCSSTMVLSVVVLWQCLQWHYGTVCSGTMVVSVVVLWYCLQWHYGTVCSGTMVLSVVALWYCLQWHCGTVCSGTVVLSVVALWYYLQFQNISNPGTSPLLTPHPLNNPQKQKQKIIFWLGQGLAYSCLFK